MMAVVAVTHSEQEQPSGRLSVCATPIGNLGDVSERLRSTLAEADVIACEDTRTARRLLAALGIPAPRLVSYHDVNEAEAADRLVDALLAGAHVALVSDAGTPSIADPGVRLVRRAREVGALIVVVPGPSAVAAALSVSGIGGSGYRFVGFLPRTDAGLRDVAARHAEETVVAFESPRRLPAALTTLAAMQPQRIAAVCRELTKVHEQVEVGVLAELIERFPAPVRGEVVIVLAALPARDAVLAPPVVDAARSVVDAGAPAKVVAKAFAAACGVSSRALYNALVRR